MFNLIVSGLYIVMALVFLLKEKEGGFWACIILSTQHGMSAC